MNLQLITFLLGIFTLVSLNGQTDLVRTNLPILVINTATAIPSEPKVKGSLGIINNGPEENNSIEDPFTNYIEHIGIELRGQSSLALFPKKSMGFETRNPDGSNSNVCLLGMPKENDWVLHGPYSDKSLMRNALAYILAGKIMDYAPRVRFVEVVINDQYEGIFLLTEKIKRDKNRVNIQKLETTSTDITGGYILKFDKGNEIAWASPYLPISGKNTPTNFLYHYPKINDITREQTNYIQNYITEFEDVLQSDNFADPIEGYRKYIDVPSFIQYFFINEISRNVDGYRLSTYMYKDSDAVGGKLKKGPAWDYNLAFGNANYCSGEDFRGWAYQFNAICPDDNWVVHFWWKRLLQDKAFKIAVKEQWDQLRQEALSTENIIGTVDSLQQLLTRSSAASRNFERWDVLSDWVWPNAFVGDSYGAEVDYLKSWTNSRLAWLDNNFADFDKETTPSTANLASVVYPNPSKESVQFDFHFQAFDVATIGIYNVLGQLIEIVRINDTEDKDFFFSYSMASRPSPGIYYYIIKSPREVVYSGAFSIVD